jgi:hypothetical protein
MTQTPETGTKDSSTADAPANGQANSQEQAPRVISDPNEVAQLVMMRIDHVNAKKDELTIAIKALADTAKQLVSVYGNQQAQIAKLAKQVDVLEKLNAKT